MSKLIRKIGFEIELAVSQDGLYEIESINDKCLLGLEFTGDGSIITTMECPEDLEIKTNNPVNYTEIIRIAKHLFPVLKKLERSDDAIVNESCGIHIHFDINTLSFKEIWNVYDNWEQWGEDWFYKILPEARRNCGHAMSIKGTDFTKWLVDKEKYLSLSPNFFRGKSYIPTIEYRLFHSTLNSFHFLNYLRLIKLFLDNRGKIADFIVDIEKNQSLLSFCELRRKEYN